MTNKTTSELCLSISLWSVKDCYSKIYKLLTNVGHMAAKQKRAITDCHESTIPPFQTVLQEIWQTIKIPFISLEKCGSRMRNKHSLYGVLGFGQRDITQDPLGLDLQPYIH